MFCIGPAHIEYLGFWEKINNADFKLVEFDHFKNEAGSNSFVLSPQKWIDKIDAVGIISKSGRYGDGTFVHNLSRIRRIFDRDGYKKGNDKRIRLKIKIKKGFVSEVFFVVLAFGL